MLKNIMILGKHFGITTYAKIVKNVLCMCTNINKILNIHYTLMSHDVRVLGIILVPLSLLKHTDLFTRHDIYKTGIIALQKLLSFFFSCFAF